MNQRRKGLTSLEALGVAIRAQQDARDVYAELAGRSEDRVIRRRFDLMAAMEEQDKEYLLQKYKDLAGGVPLKLPASWLPDEMLTPQRRSIKSVEEVLDMAIEAHRRAREFYLRSARETEDLSGRAMFRFLADRAYQHWLTLAQEKDLLIRYPHYGRPGEVPWHAERSLEEEHTHH